MKRPLQITLAASVAALGIGAGAASAADCPIKLGGIAPLSAPGTVVGGEAMRDAMLIAEEDINAKGGILGCELDVVIADSEGLPEKAAAFSGNPSESAMTTSSSQPRMPPLALMSSSAISIASRIASPPTTVPGAERGAIPPSLIGQSAADAAPAPIPNAATDAASVICSGLFMSSAPD